MQMRGATREIQNNDVSCIVPWVRIINNFLNHGFHSWVKSLVAVGRVKYSQTLTNVFKFHVIYPGLQAQAVVFLSEYFANFFMPNKNSNCKSIFKLTAVHAILEG